MRPDQLGGSDGDHTDSSAWSRGVWRPGALSMPDELARLVYVALFVALPLLVPTIGLVLLREGEASALAGAVAALCLALPMTAVWVVAARRGRWYRRRRSIAALAVARWLAGAAVPFAELWWGVGAWAALAAAVLLLAAGAFAWLGDDGGADDRSAGS